MKNKETIIAGFIRPIKLKFIQFPNSIKVKLVNFVNEKYFFRKNPIEMLKKTPAIKVNRNVVANINISFNKDNDFTKVDFKELMKRQSDFIKQAVADKKEEIKKTAYAEWEKKQKK